MHAERAGVFAPVRGEPLGWQRVVPASGANLRINIQEINMKIISLSLAIAAALSFAPIAAQAGAYSSCSVDRGSWGNAMECQNPNFPQGTR